MMALPQNKKHTKRAKNEDEREAQRIFCSFFQEYSR
jgi:hypothetical protein